MSLLIVLELIVKSYINGLVLVPHTPRGLHAALFARFAHGTCTQCSVGVWVEVSLSPERLSARDGRVSAVCSLGRGAGAGRAVRTCYSGRGSKVLSSLVVCV